MQLGRNTPVALLYRAPSIYDVDISPIIQAGKAVTAKDLLVEYA
jgi:hypothetical protein